MQKVLIISYYFPPSNFVGGSRTEYWAKNLHKHGIYPIIITRNWNKEQLELTDKILDNNYKFEKNSKYEVHRLPYRHGIRDFFAQYPNLKFFQKTVTFFEKLFSNYFLLSSPYYNFFSYAEKLIMDQNIRKVIVSASPFYSFHFGYKLKQKIPSLQWIPDYRDEWNTRGSSTKNSIFSKFFFKIESYNENKWTSNADFFITVSDLWKKNIGSKINKKGYVIKNGYENFTEKAVQKTGSKFRIVYLGTLYSYQKIELIINAVLYLVNKQNALLELHFIGSTICKNQLSKIDLTLGELNQCVFFHAKIPKIKVKKELQKYDLTVLTNYNNLSGCLPVKIFDYYASGIPILLFPTDNGLMEKFIQETKSGFIGNDVNECIEILQKCIQDKSNNVNYYFTRNHKIGKKYSRKYQTQKLAKLLMR